MDNLLLNIIYKNKVKTPIFKEQYVDFEFGLLSNLKTKQQQLYSGSVSRPIQYSKPPRSTPMGTVGAPTRPTSLQPPPMQELTPGPRANSPSFMDPNYCLCCPPNDLRFSDAMRAKQRTPLRRPFIVGDVSWISESFFINSIATSRAHTHDSLFYLSAFGCVSVRALREVCVREFALCFICIQWRSDFGGWLWALCVGTSAIKTPTDAE